jgi:hypothetical protein
MSDDRDRPRKTWREIDKGRDTSRSRDARDRGGGGGGARGASAVAQKSYRAALERAFENGTLGELARQLTKVEEPRAAPRPPAAAEPPAAPASAEPAATPAAPAATAPPTPANPERENRQKLLLRIKQAEGRDPVTRALDAFLEQYPRLPDDFEVLTKALLHRDDVQALAALAQIEALLAREKPRRSRALIAQLRILEETHDDPELRPIAARVRARAERQG